MSAEPSQEQVQVDALDEEELQRQKVLERERLFNAAAMIIDNEGVIDPALLRMPPGRPIDMTGHAFQRARQAYLNGGEAWKDYIVHDIVLLPVEE